MSIQALLGRQALAVAWLALAPTVVAAQESPHIGYVFPAGGRQGAVLELTLGGQHLAGVHGVYVDGAGMQGAVIEQHKALSRKELGELRRRLSMLRRQRGRGEPVKPVDDTESEPLEFEGRDLAQMTLAELDQLRARLFDPKRQENAQLGETVVVHLAIASNAEPGERELRLITPAGLTNPLRFDVGRLAEHVEREPNDREAERLDSTLLPLTVNGQVLPGDVDRFRFAGRAGAELVASVQARALVPYLADAVPGWFQATLALFDAHGTQLAFVDDFRCQPDPVLHATLPADGEYVLEIRDAIYRGREDFVYRIALGELPYVTGVFPLGGRAGEAVTVALRGWNLPASDLALKPDQLRPPTLSLAAAASSNQLPFAVDSLPETLALEPDDGPERANHPPRPTIVNGRIDRPGDRDVFLVTGTAGEPIVAEVTARRLQSPLDSVLWITDAAGRELARNDDHVDPGAGLVTHQADSRLSFTLPEDGRCWLHLADAQHQGGDDFAYRLRLGAPRPDFELRVVPSGINVPAGATVPLRVHALRRDGFSGAIELRLQDAPRGFFLSGGRVPPGVDEVQVTLTAPDEPREEPLRLALEGRAKVDGRQVRRLAVPAEDMMQAFLNRHLVPAHELLVAVTPRRRAAPPLRLADAEPVRLRAGGTVTVRLRGPRRAPAGELLLELRDVPDGVTLGERSLTGPEASFVLHADAARVEPGWQGNVIVEVFLERPVASRDGSPQGRVRRTSLGVLPAVRLAIVRAR